ncbi:hypothetical protein M8J76_001131 [Diaphorina citri]|nr:hypothetical protein M8J75_002003 [Diaphorina citri]KAI5736217.1 hypothetical protein M8J76_001131 [Diaphorina citri]KAI5742995.1 hypothetical protein M8J77_013447 [Diaphorina citri]
MIFRCYDSRLDFLYSVVTVSTWYLLGAWVFFRFKNVKQNPERGPSDKGCNSTLTSQKQILMSPNRGLGILVTFSNENYRPCKGTW